VTVRKASVGTKISDTNYFREGGRVVCWEECWGEFWGECWPLGSPGVREERVGRVNSGSKYFKNGEKLG
jgi:hypothetical protein